MANDITVRAAQFPFPDDGDPVMAEEMAAQTAGVELIFPRAKIPSGGMQVFDMEDEAPKTLTGVIVEQHAVNAYWPDADSADGNPPVCSSSDGVTGLGEGGVIQECAQCPFNAFGSGEGGIGKACKNKTRVHILREGALLPVQIDLPATSMKPFARYLGYLRSAGLLPSSVITEIGLERKTYGQNQVAVATFRAVSRLDPANAAQSLGYTRALRSAIRRSPAGE